MSKTFRKNKTSNYSDDYEEDYMEYKQDYYKRKMNKRIKNAIRARDIDSLMEMDEDDDFVQR